ncbi:hypothetical protein H7F15_08390 [Pontibacter sp. Tf4]|uniref:hypothetical protein n=1 Tax=Pontibacter sp. Tf4 TaxID=2761620 RepID=UPI0016239BBD|nr:hypothetical protein [Pontibacter sp. Tf4]MBB6611052.1 hypothetical protein [Pontibacter sp. Tf4]
MKQIYLLALLLVFSATAFAQSAFVPGYFIDNAGNRVECFIRNYDKRINPSNFEYRLTEDGQTEIATINDVQEFEILNTVHKYKRFEVEIDRSSNDIEHLTNFREPYFNKEARFLRLLVEGKASLYGYYEADGFERFFAGMPGKKVEQLIYKKYFEAENLLGENKMFQNQLAMMLSCEAISADRLNKTSYQERALLKLFMDYNACINSEVTNYSDRRQKGEFRLTPKVGINTSSTKMTYYYKILTVYYESEFNSGTGRTLSPQIAVEAEYVFPFYNKSWSFFVEPGIQWHKQDVEGEYKRHQNIKSDAGTISVNYTHFSVPFGFKYAHTTGSGNRIFVKGAMSFNSIIDDSDVYEAEGFKSYPDLTDQSFFQKASYAAGIGYANKKRMSLEVIYHIDKKVVDDGTWEIEMVKSFSVLFGYRIL